MITVVEVRNHDIAVLSCGHKTSQGRRGAPDVGTAVVCPICTPLELVVVRTALVQAAHPREVRALANHLGETERAVARHAALNADPLDALKRRLRLLNVHMPP